MDNNLDAINHAKNEIIDLAIRFGPRVLVAVLVLIAGVVVGGWIGRATERGLARMELEPPLRLLMVRLVRLLVFALFAILALQNLGVELLPLIAGLSIAGAGIALATQGILSNLFAGLTIIFTKPYRVGDYIEIAGVQGQVQLITIFSTTLLHADRSHVVVPNRKVVGEILHNYGQIRQAEVKVGVGYEVDLPQAIAAIHELVAANTRVLRDPAPQVQIVALAESMVQIALRPWVAVTDYPVIIGELSLAVVETCRRRGISIPFPQREVRLIGGG
jgi:small conductance mechanosensitive channel